MNPKKCPECGNKTWLVEYSHDSPEHYDGVSEYACEGNFTEPKTCNWRIGRWCGKQLNENEIEPRYHKSGAHSVHI